MSRPIREIVLPSPGTAVAFGGERGTDAVISAWAAGEQAPRATRSVRGTILSGGAALDRAAGTVVVRAGAASVLLVDPATLETRHLLVHRGVDSVRAAGARIVTAGAGRLALHDAATGALLELREHAGLPATVRAYHPAPDRLAYATPRGRIGFLATAALEPLAARDLPDARYVASAPDRIAVLLGEDLWVWDAEADAMCPVAASAIQSARFAGDALVVATGDAVLTCDRDGAIVRRLAFSSLVPARREPIYCTLVEDRRAVIRHGDTIARVDLDAGTATSWTNPAPVEGLHEGLRPEVLDGDAVVSGLAGGAVGWHGP